MGALGNSASLWPFFVLLKCKESPWNSLGLHSYCSVTSETVKVLAVLKLKPTASQRAAGPIAFWDKGVIQDPSIRCHHSKKQGVDLASTYVFFCMPFVCVLVCVCACICEWPIVTRHLPTGSLSDWWISVFKVSLRKSIVCLCSAVLAVLSRASLCTLKRK